MQNSVNYSTQTIVNKIRAFASYGFCYIIHQGIRVKIISAAVSTVKLSDLDVQCYDGFVCPKLIKPEGRGQMSVVDFINGLKSNARG